MDTITFTLQPIPPAAANDLREIGGPIYVADSNPGYPCRQCLRDGEIGEELILVSHNPFTRDSPYRCASPIFLHLDPCQPPPSTDELPTQLTIRQLSVRSFDDEALMIDAAVIDGQDLRDTLVRLFEDPASTEIHVHNAQRGCWATTVERRSP
jgi:hypothetical protein